jgi:dienelactone hydrolase
MQTTFVEYHDGATLLEAAVARPATEAATRPAVLICHAWAGRSAFECQVAEQLSALGYVGIALDNYGKGVLGTSNEENAALMNPLLQDRAALRRRLQAGLAAARTLPYVDGDRIAVIGYCFGGLCALDLARSGATIRGAVSFHGLFNAPESLPNAQTIHARVLALHGHDDPMVPPEAVLELEQELTKAGVDWQVHAYGGTAHAFTNPQAQAPAQGMQYNATAARRAWQSMQHFLAEVLA